jgi:hypothetical protein
MKKRDLPEIPKQEEKIKSPEPKVVQKESWLSRNTWWFFITGFIFIPAIVRWIFNGLIINAVGNYWNLGGLGQASVEVAESSRKFADLYARISFNTTFLVIVALLLVAFIIVDKIDVEKWGLHWKYIIPALLYFGGFWVIIYFFFVPVGSILSGGESYMIGWPPPKGLVTDGPFVQTVPFWKTLQYMFMPKSIVAFTINNGQQMVHGSQSSALGWLEFIRVWLLRGPVVIFSTFGYVFNKLQTWFRTPGWIAGAKRGDDDVLHPWFKYAVAFLFSAILVPVYQAVFVLVSGWMAPQTINVEGADMEVIKYATSTPSVMWIIVFWLVIAIAFNLALKWAYVDRIKRKLSDWERSLYKWLPGFGVLVIGLIISFASGWHLAPINPETGLVMNSVTGPFSTSDIGTFIYLFVCFYTYIRTRNLIIPALIYSSLPYFLNFIRVTPNVTPTYWGSLIAFILTIIILIAYTEVYRFWAPWLTFNVVREEPVHEEGEISEEAEKLEE